MNTINGSIFKEMLKSADAHLYNRQKEIDALNVFPVPDGDTGTNMAMTLASGVKDASNAYSENIGDVAKALSRGLLMGARGNSGVITSQIFRGFAQSVEGKKEIDTHELSEAFENGAKVAYKAIMKPVEGTILTVVREASWYANHYLKEHDDLSIEEFFDKLIEYAKDRGRGSGFWRYRPFGHHRGHEGLFRWQALRAPRRKWRKGRCGWC